MVHHPAVTDHAAIISRSRGSSAIPSVAIVVSLVGLIVAVSVVLAMWLPYYIVGSEGQLFLFPLALVVGALAMLMGAAGCILGVVAAVRGRPRAVGALAAVVGLIVVLGTLPAIWFGNVLTFI
jgi:hypothetical protein